MSRQVHQSIKFKQTGGHDKSRNKQGTKKRRTFKKVLSRYNPSSSPAPSPSPSPRSRSPPHPQRCTAISSSTLHFSSPTPSPSPWFLRPKQGRVRPSVPAAVRRTGRSRTNDGTAGRVASRSGGRAVDDTPEAVGGEGGRSASASARRTRRASWVARTSTCASRRSCCWGAMSQTTRGISFSGPRLDPDPPPQRWKAAGQLVPPAPPPPAQTDLTHPIDSPLPSPLLPLLSLAPPVGASPPPTPPTLPYPLSSASSPRTGEPTARSGA